MNLQICESPKRIFSKDEHKFIYVRCGKCNTCKNIKASTWVQRIKQESQCWPYTFFYTLTFDEKNVPHFVFDDSLRSLVDPSNGLSISLDDISFPKHYNDVQRRLYVSRRRFIPYVTPQYHQEFMKRLRYYIDSYLKKYPNDCKILRFFAVSEYGPSTYRPHVHGLLWFKSSHLPAVLSSFITKAWTFGRVDCSPVKNSAADYVARYVNCVSALPRVYLHKQIRPFCIQSKLPAIGTLSATHEELSQIVVNGTVQRTIVDYKSLSSKDVPLWRSFESKLFPKIQSFNVLCHRDRVTLYSVFKQSCAETFEDFLEWVYKVLDKHNAIHNPVQTLVSHYLQHLYDVSCNGSSPDKLYPLRNLYYISKHVYYQRQVFNFTLDQYVYYIEQYYSNKELYKLRCFYHFQEVFANDYGSNALIFAYENWKEVFEMNVNLEELNNDKSLFRSFSVFAGSPYFENFGYTPIDISSLPIDEIYPLSNRLDFTLYSVSSLLKAYNIFDIHLKNMVRFNLLIQVNSQKTKKKNDYLDFISQTSYGKLNLNFDFYKTYA